MIVLLYFLILEDGERGEQPFLFLTISRHTE